MRKLASILLFAALFAPIANAAGLFGDADGNFLSRIATYLKLRKSDPAPASAAGVTSNSTALGPGGPCVCTRPGTSNVVEGTWTTDPNTGLPVCDCGCLGGLRSPDRLELFR